MSKAIKIVNKKKKQITFDELEKLMRKHKNGLIPDYDYNLGYVKGLAGGESNELDRVLSGAILLGITLANKEKLSLVEEENEEEFSDGTIISLDKDSSPSYLG